MKLKHLADITMGHSFRSRLEQVEGGNMAVIQMKDLTEDNRLNVAAMARVDLGEVKTRQYVEPNDIVFRSRGQTNTAVLITGDVGDAVIAAPLLRIRPKEAVLPAYLAWFINLPASQAWLVTQAKGTAVRMISKQALAGLVVVVPSLERQRAIVQLAELVDEEQRLLKQLAVKRKRYMERILMQAASGSQGV
ncbi:MAG: restriction endonuclease subunit S [Candidatus Thiodiazotropha sp. (ex Lucinoma kastoroae)]|nr:restriction endonuclease subunit S [Candidatus Thiodiazotropha sp. (ex Lucinoma kastoroae)]